MNDLKLTLRSLGLDGWVFGITSVAAIFFGVLSFLGVIPFDQRQVSSVMVGAIGLLMVAVMTQTARRHAEILELRATLGLSESQSLSSSREFGQHLVPSVLRTKLFVLDMLMTARRSPSFFSGSQAEYKRVLFKRTSKGEIGFRRVEVIYNVRNLEDVVRRLLLHEGYNYFIRHYEPPPKIIPILHMMSFDNEAFYLGGFYASDYPGEEQNLYIRDPKLAYLLKGYWNELWGGGTPLNEGGVIDWTELKRIGARAGVTESDFEAMVAKVRGELQREKHRL